MYDIVHAVWEMSFEIVTNQKLMRIIVTNTIRFDTARMYAVLVLLLFLFVFFSIYIYLVIQYPGFLFHGVIFPENIMLMRNVSMQFDTAIYDVLVFFAFFCLVVWVFCKYVYIYLVILYFPWQLHLHAMQCDLSGNYYVNCKNLTFSFAMSISGVFPNGG